MCMISTWPRDRTLHCYMRLAGVSHQKNKIGRVLMCWLMIMMEGTLRYGAYEECHEEQDFSFSFPILKFYLYTFLVHRVSSIQWRR